MKVAHLTSVHPRFDTRIFRKECLTLHRADYEVSLVVADGHGDAVVEGVNILDVGMVKGGRLRRMTASANSVYERARALGSDLYHLHDPELLPIGLKLKRAGHKVIFDSHEDYPADILTKAYLKPGLRRLVSSGFSVFECYACPKLDYIVAATPAIRAKFEHLGCAVVDINNFPLVAEFDEGISWESKRTHACYVGAMTSIRGVPELVDAMALTDPSITLSLVGEFTEDATAERAKASRGWQRVREHGFLGRKELRATLAHSFAGVVTFLPAPNHVDAQPNKMFEYMAAGVPVIGSHFPLWREILGSNDCGICVDPGNPSEIARAIDMLFHDQERGRSMGERGRAAVLSKYNWERESSKLLELYGAILQR
ncbi:MAG: glycosyltransferase family 4 protein [Rhizobiales bacterium]|nr:glycosyltransferase family 4 protein [Hyphomicrobiales bacterium]